VFSRYFIPMGTKYIWPSTCLQVTFRHFVHMSRYWKWHLERPQNLSPKVSCKKKTELSLNERFAVISNLEWCSLPPPLPHSAKTNYRVILPWELLIISRRNEESRCSVVSWRTMLQTGRSRVRFPMRSMDFSIGLILPAALWPWGRFNL
jgi:hypothetical protein